MLRSILKREILHNLYSLRFVLSLALVLGVFAAGSIFFVKNREAAMEKARQVELQAVDKMKADARRNATVLAVTRRTVAMAPRADAFVAEAREKYLPNTITFSAWNVFGFENRSGSANPFLTRYDELNWSFIASLILSFVALLFTFDAVSGEKETKTLALALSNPVSRATLLAGKYLSAVLSVLVILIPGILVSLLILIVSGGAAASPILAAETLGFLLAVVLLTAAMAAVGLLCSVVARSSNVSLLLALSAWLLFVVVIPNSSAFIAKTLYPIPKVEAVQERVRRTFDDLNKSAPPGSWMMHGGNPFLPQHQLRANLQRKRLAAEKAIRDAFYRDMFRQFERTRRLTAISPAASFEFLAEAVVGGGYARFRKVWDDLHVFQAQFQSFFQALDAADPKSPHWHNPNEDVSTTRKPVSFETVPQFTEKPLSLAQRVRPALAYVLMTAISACLVYALAFLLFVRYDVR